MEIIIDYKPRKWAEILHNAKTRWFVMILHRRAGKTTAVLNHLQRDCIRISKSQFAYIGPTYKQTKRIAWEILKLYSRDIPGIEYNESELTVKYPNGSRLFLAGSENIDALRGIALWGVGFDEYPQQPSNIFSEVISKCLADHLGYAIFFGTPKGKEQLWKTWKNAQDNPDWTVIFKTIDDSLKEESGETIDNLRIALEDDKRLVLQGMMTQDEFNQEWYCSFEAAIKGAYYAEQIAEARKNNRIKAVPYDKALKVHTVWDLGVGRALGIGFYQRIGNETHLIDYWEGGDGQGIVDGIKEIQRKDYIYGSHFAPHDINAKELMSGKVRIETARELGINFEIVPMINVIDGIDKGRLMWSRLWVDENNCDDWLNAISQYKSEWDEEKGKFGDKPVHDWTSHAADVHRYASLIEDKMTNDDGFYNSYEAQEARMNSQKDTGL